ncbi:MAG: FtsK/SpoIIIE domain-containing protein [Byssovorax sp.]
MSAARGPGLRRTDAISVTEVRNALRCPRLFTLGRSTGKTVQFPVASSALGATFHRLIEQFSRSLDSPPAPVASLAEGSTAEALRGAVVRWLLDDHLVPELERNPVYARAPGEVEDLAEAMRQFAGFLAERAAKMTGRPALSLSRLVARSELVLESVIDLASIPGSPEGAGTVRITGRADALFQDDHLAAEIVEYKLTSSENALLDVAQVALYRRLLRDAQGIDATPIVLRFEPELTVTRTEAAAADRLVDQRILPLIRDMVRWLDEPGQTPATARLDICAACPMRDPCREAHPARVSARDAATPSPLSPTPEGLIIAAPHRVASLLEGATAVSPPSRSSENEASRSPEPATDSDARGEAEAQALEAMVLEEFKRRGVNARIQKRIISARLVRIEMSVPPRSSLKHLDQHAEDVCHHLAQRLGDAKLQPVYESGEGQRVFIAPRRQPRAVELEVLLRRDEDYLRRRPGRFVVGEGLDGAPVRGDLSDGATPHLLVAGQAGSGKSVFLRALVLGMTAYHPPSQLQMVLVDPKLVTFADLEARMGAHLQSPVLNDVEEVLPKLDELVDEMARRYELFKQKKVQDLHQYNDVVSAEDRLIRTVMVVDEFADLLFVKSSRAPFLQAIQRLGAKARAAGIHLILATQHPTVKMIPGEIKANLGGKIALRVSSAVNSRVVLDVGGAEKLLGAGDLIADLGRGPVRAQAPLA